MENFDPDYLEAQLDLVFEACGLTERQAALVRYRVFNEEAPNYECAREAGYKPDKNGEYHTRASEAFSSKSVQKAIEKARQVIRGQTVETGDLAELEYLLWQEARFGSGQSKIAAIKLLHDMKQPEPDPQRDMEAVCREIWENLPTLAEYIAIDDPAFASLRPSRRPQYMNGADT